MKVQLTRRDTVTLTMPRADARGIVHALDRLVDAVPATNVLPNYPALLELVQVLNAAEHQFDSDGDIEEVRE